MVRIRLRRMGAKKKPFYRIVVADQRSPRDGRFIEVIGTYDPHPEPPEIVVNIERVTHWINTGAQPSNSVERLLRQRGILDDSGMLIGEAASEDETESSETVEDAVVEAIEEAVEEAEAVAETATE